MSNAYKILAQAAPDSGVLVDLYTVPEGKSCIVSTFNVANSTGDASFRLAVSKNGESDSLKQYIYRDLEISSKDSYSATEGWTLGAGDVVRAYASLSGLAFNLFGTEF